MKMYLYNTNRQNYGRMVRHLDKVLEDIACLVVPIGKALPKVLPYFHNCEGMVEHWLLHGDVFLAHNIEGDPSTLHNPDVYTEYMQEHARRIVAKMDSDLLSGSLQAKWSPRFHWIQEFVHALHAAKLIGMDTAVLVRSVQSEFKMILRSSMLWLGNCERDTKMDAYNGLFSSSQQADSQYGYWTAKEIEGLSSSSTNQVPFALLLKNAQYYRALNTLNVSMYAYDDVNSFIHISKMLHKPLRQHKHLCNLIEHFKIWTAQVEGRWKREKEAQLGKTHYDAAKVMWSPWCGLAPPSLNALKTSGPEGQFLIDLFNFGLKAVTVDIASEYSWLGVATWDLYVSILNIIARDILPDLEASTKPIQEQYSKFLKLWSDPETRESMLLLRLLSSNVRDGFKWKECVLSELKELPIRDKILYNIENYVTSL